MNSELAELRAQIDDFFEFHPQSPLDDTQIADFDGLSYYPENPDLRLEVAVAALSAEEPLIQMETSTGDLRLYRRWGTFEVEVDGVSAEVTLYSDPHGHDFFLPFKDATNSDETYGAGRYLDNHRPAIVQLDDTHFIIDFNYAYNPYCAYNPNYSCPLPPRANWLAVPIRAGEKDFA